MHQQSSGERQRILVIRAGALGDCVLMLPTLAALRAHFPRARIDVMGYPMRWVWSQGRGIVDEVHAIERPGMHLMFCEGVELPAPLTAFLGGYDTVLSYRPDPEGTFTANLRKLGVRSVLSQSPFPPPPPPKVHVADHALQLTAALGVLPPAATPRLHASAAERASVQPFFSEHGIDPGRDRLVVLHPGSGGESRRWPIERVAALARLLGAQARVRIVIITGYAEQGIATLLFPLIEAVDPIVAENWPLIPLIGLLAYAAVFVGNDSGLTHLAAAFDRPTVAIFGPSDPEVWGPRGERVAIVQARSVQRAGSGQARAGSEEPWPDVAHVLHAARTWLEAADLRQSRDDRSGRS